MRTTRNIVKVQGLKGYCGRSWGFNCKGFLDGSFVNKVWF